MPPRKRKRAAVEESDDQSTNHRHEQSNNESVDQSNLAPDSEIDSSHHFSTGYDALIDAQIDDHAQDEELWEQDENDDQSIEQPNYPSDAHDEYHDEHMMDDHDEMLDELNRVGQKARAQAREAAALEHQQQQADGSFETQHALLVPLTRTQIAIEDDDDQSTSQSANRSSSQASSSNVVSIQIPRHLLRVANGSTNESPPAKKKTVAAIKLTSEQRAMIGTIQKGHFLSYLVLIKRWCQVADFEELQASMLSILPDRLILNPKTFTLNQLEHVVKWWHDRCALTPKTFPTEPLLSKCSGGNWLTFIQCLIRQCHATVQFGSGLAMAKVLLFIALMRGHGIRTRLVYGMLPVQFQTILVGTVRQYQAPSKVDQLQKSSKNKSVRTRPRRDVLAAFWKTLDTGSACDCKFVNSVTEWNSRELSINPSTNTDQPGKKSVKGGSKTKSGSKEEIILSDDDPNETNESPVNKQSMKSSNIKRSLDVNPGIASMNVENNDVPPAKRSKRSAPAKARVKAEAEDVEDIELDSSSTQSNNHSINQSNDQSPDQSDHGIDAKHQNSKEEPASKRIKRKNVDHSDVCVSCEQSTNGTATVLLCDGCDMEWHMKCVKPRLRTVPRGKWLCITCKAKQSVGDASNSEDEPLIKSSDQHVDDNVVEKPVIKRSRAKAVKVEKEEIVKAETTAVKRSARAKAKPKVVTVESDDDFEDSPAPSSNNSRTRRTSDQSTKSSTKRTKSSNSSFVEFWCEVYCPTLGRWVHVDPINNLIDTPHEYEGSIRPKRVFAYVLAAYPPNNATSSHSSNSASSTDAVDAELAASLINPVIEDVTDRYSVGIKGTVPRQRLPEQWVSAMLKSISSRATPMDVARRKHELETFNTSATETNKGFPTTLTALKKHPLYCTTDMAKKYEMLRPGARVVKQININNKIYQLYMRTDMSELHTADRWLREMRQVKESELEHPAKLVKSNTMLSRKRARIQRQQIQAEMGGDLDRVSFDGRQPNNAANVPDEEKTLLYGQWQTEPLKKGAAKDGIVPKNARGHVDMWDESFLPDGCVHLAYPRIASIARKLNIDCAEAMIGFDIKQGRSVPAFNGIIVAEENAQTVLEAYWLREAEIREKEEKKRMDAIVVGWRRIVRASIIRSRLMKELQARTGSTEQLNDEPDDESLIQSTKQSKKSKKAIPRGAAAEEKIDVAHVHEFSQTSMIDGAWLTSCKCGAVLETNVEIEDL